MSLLPPRLSPVQLASVLLLGVGLLLDLFTPAALVVSILLNIPIALSALALSRRFTLTLVGLALAADALAGVFNALQEGSFDLIALVNRVLSALSFLVVGLLTTGLNTASARVARLEVQQRRADTERRLRELGERVSGPHTPAALLTRAVGGLRALLGAEWVLLGAIQGESLGPPLVSDPPTTPPPAHLPAEWLAVPVGATRAFAADGYLIGRWRRREGGDLLVLVAGAEGGAALLDQALAVLEPALEVAVLLSEVRAGQLAAERQTAVVRDLVYAFSHDLRTPLMANLMSMRLALAGAYGELPEDYRASLHSGLQANQDLLSLADQLLVVARLESGEAGHDFERLDFGALVTGRAEAMRADAEARGFRLEIEAGSGLTLSGSAPDLRRIAQNLIENALKWSPPGGTVRVRVQREGNSARLTVTDGGPGVPPELRQRLFQRFRGQGAGAGSGLGLYLARRIAEAHGGSIAYSRAEGGPTTFQVRLPLAPEPT